MKFDSLKMQSDRFLENLRTDKFSFSKFGCILSFEIVMSLHYSEGKGSLISFVPKAMLIFLSSVLFPSLLLWKTFVQTGLKGSSNRIGGQVVRDAEAEPEGHGVHRAAGSEVILDTV